MLTTLETFTVEELLDGFQYSVSENKGLFGLNGLLTIQPEYQRSYIYHRNKLEEDVVRSVLNGLPLGLLYFEKTFEGQLQVIDGQQRITSLGRFATNCMPVDAKYFDSINENERKLFLSAKLLAYICEGTESEIKSWFRTINTGGEKITEQEMLNAVYSGKFVSAARAHLSNSSDPQVTKRSHFVKGDVDRQGHLEVALKWISRPNDIESYMSQHRRDPNADELIHYFEDVIRWAGNLFPLPDRLKPSVDWGLQYDTFKDTPYNREQLEADLLTLQSDDRVTVKKRIYEYLLNGQRQEDRKLLSLRCFSSEDMTAAYARQLKEAKSAGLSNCPLCAHGPENNRTRIYPPKDMEADHVQAWSKGGLTDASNCQMLCVTHNRAKGNR